MSNNLAAVHRTACIEAKIHFWTRAIKVNRPSLHPIIVLLPLGICLTSCAMLSRHQFTEPAPDWQSRNGQLLYRSPKTTLIGEVFTRFSKNGDFELTFSKGPGVTLLIIRQDTSFAEVRGALAGPGWSGPANQAPKRLRPWLGLRDQLIRSQDRHAVRYVAGSETFLFRF
jgi:hypothetical protein